MCIRDRFNCEELAQFDKEHLLPDHGLLSFFYETDTQCWGYDPKDKGCARVYWFEDLSALSAANFPADMEEDFKFPMVKIKVDSKYSYPSWEDFSEVFPDEEDDDAFDDAWEELKMCIRDSRGSRPSGTASTISPFTM